MLVNALNITSSPQYLHQDNKPVLVIWGLGFTDRPVDVQGALAIINYFKTEAGVSQYLTRKKALRILYKLYFRFILLVEYHFFGVSNLVILSQDFCLFIMLLMLFLPGQ
jgi:hypothetical protein